MRQPKTFFNLLRLLLTGLVVLLLSTACSTTTIHPDSPKMGMADYAHYPEGGGLFVSVAFATDGRLWRVVPEKNHVYVDYSNDLGQSFSAPVRLNADSQKIKVSGENHPSIAVDQAGRVYVIYTAEGVTQAAVLYLSISSDNGKSFSTPVPLSDKASEANSFQGRLALNRSGQAYIFWHDERNRTDWQKPGNAIYYTRIDVENKRSLASQQVADMLCECCRLAVTFDADNTPVLFARFIYEGGIRDHGLIKTTADGRELRPLRATFDKWQIEACPEHGPAIAIGNDGQYHIAWFSQGSIRQGLFYAHSSDKGEHFSEPMALSAPAKLPSHPDVMTQGNHVFLTWVEFDGQKKRLQIMQSKDAGATWLAAKTLADSASETDYPFLLSSKQGVFISWNSKKEGYRLIPVP